MKRVSKNPNYARNDVVALSMLPHYYRALFRRIDICELNTVLLVGPNQLVFSVPTQTRLLCKAARLVRDMTLRKLSKINVSYTEKYTIDDLHNMPYIDDIFSADREDQFDLTQDYLDSINVLVYLGQTCNLCDNYITEVGFTELSEPVTQCVSCGNIAIDTVTTDRRHITYNLTGDGLGTYKDV